MEVENRLYMSPTIGKLADALSKAQGEIKGAIKDSTNPFFKAGYSTLCSVWECCREPLSKNGLAIVQIPHESDQQVIIETILMHTSGEWVSGKISMKPVKTDPQSIGSAMTYARRYALSAMVGVAPIEEDDDGNAATGKTTPPKKPKEEPYPPDYSGKENKSEPPDATTQEKPVSQEEINIKFNEFLAKMVELEKENVIPHTKNWWSKNLPEISKLPPEMKKTLVEYKVKLLGG